MSIEKFNTATLNKDSVPFTQLPNIVIQNLTHPLAFMLWAYLCSMPSDWIVCKEQLCKHFHKNRETINKAFNVLYDHKLASFEQPKLVNGKFCDSKINIHLGVTIIATFELKEPKPLVQAMVQSSVQSLVQNGDSKNNITNINNSIIEFEPQTGFPCTVKPGTGKTATTNKQLTNKHESNKINIKRYRSSDDEQPIYFDQFWNIYKRKQKKKEALRIWKKEKLDQIANLILADVEKRSRLDHQWQNKRFIPLPSTYLNGAGWTDEIIQDSVAVIKSKSSIIDDAPRSAVNRMPFYEAPVERRHN